MLGQIRKYVARVFADDEVQKHYGSRRLECWWEPIFGPELHGRLDRAGWCFDDTAGPSKKYFTGPSLVAETAKGVLHEIKSVTFVDCDFQGNFDPETIVMFDDCRFIRCDFAYSYWRDTHFRECHFEDSSFSLASFSRCQFRDNTWINLGFSGSKTDLEHCHVTNPSKLICAGFSGTKPNDKTIKHKFYQWYRLQGTKAHLARTLLASHETTGDDATFYETAKIHDLQQSFAVIAKNCYNIFSPKDQGRFSAVFGLSFSILENVLLRFFGLINGWGASIIRPLFALAVLFITCSIIYRTVFGLSLEDASQKSFNITILVGYSNEYKDSLISNIVLAQNVHAVVSIVIYTVFFGTIISKLSRVR